jgi:hypothetical protein
MRPTTTVDKLTPGTRIRVIQQIDRREGDWHAQVEGTVVDVGMRPTGSWFVGKPHGRYPLKRITLRKDDGELTVLSLDEDSRVEIVPAP